ncbi:MAG: hypothetical protein R3B46_01905 [Phycisphaerales bacterium]
MRHNNHPAIAPEIQSPDAIPHGPLSGEMPTGPACSPISAPVWGEPPQRWPATVNQSPTPTAAYTHAVVEYEE